MKPIEKNSFIKDYGESQSLRQLSLLMTAL